MMLGEREGSVDDGMDNPLFGGSPRMRNDGDVENANGLRKRTSSSTALTSLDDPSLTIGLLEDSYEDEQSKVNKLYMFLFAGGVIMQGVLFLSLWVQWYRGIRQAHKGGFTKNYAEDNDEGYDFSQAQVFYWLLEFATLVWISQFSQAPKHIDPSKDTVWDMLLKFKTNMANVTASNPVPGVEQQVMQNHDQTMLENLAWHARMVWSPVWNLMFGGVCLNLLNFVTLEHAAAAMPLGECTINIWGVLNNMPGNLKSVMTVGLASFVLAAGFLFKLSTQHFDQLTEGYIKFFRSTQSVDLLQAAVDKTNRGASIFSTGKMLVVYIIGMVSQSLLLFVMSVVSGVSDGGDGLIGSITFGILLFERFLVGFQLALIFSYITNAFDLPDGLIQDTAVPDIQIRERIKWHGSMIFYSMAFAILQSFFCLPALLTVIPFFEESQLLPDTDGSSGQVRACAGLDLGLGSKIENATASERMAFFGCLSLMGLTFCAQMWLTRTHFIQYWKHLGSIIFIPDNDEQAEEDVQMSARRKMQLKQQRLLLTRSSRLRGVVEGDSYVVKLLYSCCVKALLDRMGIGVQLLDDFVGLSDLDVRTALTQQLEANYREWKTLDDMDSQNSGAIDELRIKQDSGLDAEGTSGRKKD